MRWQKAAHRPSASRYFTPSLFSFFSAGAPSLSHQLAGHPSTVSEPWLAGLSVLRTVNTTTYDALPPFVQVAGGSSPLGITAIDLSVIVSCAMLGNKIGIGRKICPQPLQHQRQKQAHNKVGPITSNMCYNMLQPDSQVPILREEHKF